MSPLPAICFDVIAQCQRYDVGIKTVDDGTRLTAGAAMRLLDLDDFTGLALPVLGEGLVEIVVQLACRIVGNIQQRGVGPCCASGADGQCGQADAGVRHDVLV